MADEWDTLDPEESIYPLLKSFLPVSIFYNANVAFALASLKGVNIPMYIAIKRLTPLAVLIAGYLFGKGKPTTQVYIPLYDMFME